MATRAVQKTGSTVKLRQQEATAANGVAQGHLHQDAGQDPGRREGR